MTAGDGYARLVDDLYAERQVVEAVLAKLDDSAWDVASAAEGWTLRDCVAHLADTDDNATLGIDPAGAPPPMPGDREGVLTPGQRRARGLPPHEVLAGTAKRTAAWSRRCGDAKTATGCPGWASS